MNQETLIDLELLKQSNKRVKKDEVFAVIENAAISLSARRDSTYVSVNYQDFIDNKKQVKEESKKLEDLEKENDSFKIISLMTDADIVKGDTTKVTKEKI